MTEPADPQMALMFSFYEGVLRKGPGSKESTLKALSMLEHLLPRTRIIDFGCGSGAASLVLANSTKCHVTAVDIHHPFLDELQIVAARDGLADRITTVQADMAEPQFPDQSFDLIWSEGAIYNVGFAEGLKCWRRFLPIGGYFAVTEVTWITPSPPQRALNFWQAEYPAITSIEDNLNKVRSAGFEAVGHFVLPPKDWENYYGPLEEHLAAFRSKHSTNNEARSLADSVQHEIDVWREFGNCYGYIFYLGKAI